MTDLKTISAPVQKDLEDFNVEFKKLLKSKIPLLNIILKYVLKAKGKQIRPILVFLSANLIGKPGNSTITAASLIELMHTSTLIHDDVVDESYERRGFLSINAIWKSKIAVLLGDYLLAKGLLLTLDHNEYDMLHIVSDAVKQMIEGELLQIQKTRKLNITEEQYFEIIRMKTATLLAACTAAGARSVTDDKETISLMHDFGLNLGIAFQIKDDLFDYDRKNISGKPRGNDIKEKKLTLPLIHSLSVAPNSEKKKIIKQINKKSSAKDTHTNVIEFVNQYGGIEYATKKMYEFRDSALEKIKSFESGEAKKSIEDLANFIVERNK